MYLTILCFDLRLCLPIHLRHLQTNMPSFTMSDVEVQHRYSDFHNLYKYLVESYQGVIVPMCPPKDAVGAL